MPDSLLFLIWFLVGSILAVAVLITILISGIISDARVLISAVKNFGVKKAIGYEIALWPYLEARFAIWSSGIFDRAVVYHQNFFKTDLSNARFVYMYLFPELVDRLAYKLADELKSGGKILCPSFPIDLARHRQFKLLKSEKIGKIIAYLYEKI